MEVKPLSVSNALKNYIRIDMMKHCNNIFLRGLKPADIEYLARYSDDTDLPFSQPFQSFFEQETIQNPPATPWDNSLPEASVIGFAIMEDEHLVGQIHLSAVNLEASSCSITMGIAKKGDRNRGLGSCALIMALRYSFVSLGLNQVSAHTLSPNESAKQCLKNTGFKEVGVEKNVFSTKREFIHRHHFIINRQDFLTRYP